jgi:hypothetical protein
MVLLRTLRNLKAAIKYPFWIVNKKGPDNHIYKMRRITTIAQQYSCNTFIETGTFYGQTVNYVKRYFKKTMSVEIYKPLYDYNLKAFKGIENIFLFNGDSTKRLPEMLSLSEGRCLFWLDGHFSGLGTGIGDNVSPIIEELNIIKSSAIIDHCILIDDYRLFGNEAGYPTIAETTKSLLSINPSYRIQIDCDCIMALP